MFLGILVLALIAGAAYLMPRMFEQAPQQVQVPVLIGKSERQARSLIGDAGLAVGEVTYRTDDTVKADRVVEQDPTEGQYVDPGVSVDLVVSTGRAMVSVPSVIGQTKKEAQATLTAQKFLVDLEEQESDAPRGQVTETKPAAGTSVPEGSTITVYYSDGQEDVPDVVGKQQDEAEQVLRDAGFEPNVVRTTDTTEPAGTVIDQSPDGGKPQPEGTTVTIVVSAFVEPTTPPPTTPTSPPPSSVIPPTLPPTSETPTP